MGKQKRIREAVEEATIETVVDALKEFVGRWDTPVEFQLDGQPLVIEDITDTPHLYSADYKLVVKLGRA